MYGDLESWAPLEAQGFDRALFDDTSARHFIEDHLARGTCGRQTAAATPRCVLTTSGCVLCSEWADCTSTPTTSIAERDMKPLIGSGRL